jgi:hypothetical protein
MTFNAGIARKIITPPPAIYLIGYGDRLRGNQGVHDDLTATALALDDGRQQVVIVACDLLAINEQTVRRILAQTGPNVVICCSHTHSGPITYADQRSPRKDRDYIDQLVAQITLAVEEAQSNLQPAQLAWAQGEAGIAVNRRERKEDGHIEIGINPSGPIAWPEESTRLSRLDRCHAKDTRTSFGWIRDVPAGRDGRSQPQAHLGDKRLRGC